MPRKIQDPTFEEMKEHIASLPLASEFDSFDVAEAIYAFASDHHGGQFSNLYSAISLCGFNPGMCWREPQSFTAQYVYEALQLRYA